MPGSKRVIALQSIVGDDETDTLLLRKMADEAERYIRSFPWCLELKEGFLTDQHASVTKIIPTSTANIQAALTQSQAIF